MMSLKFLIATLSCAWLVIAAPLEPRSVIAAQSVYDNLVYYFKYASSAYSPICIRPNGNTLVIYIHNLGTGTQGFIARDDNKKEIIVALRGTSSLLDAVTDVEILLTNYQSSGVSAPSGVQVHSGFLNAYNSVANSVISAVKIQLASYPNYKIVTSGHSLGGALSSLAAVSLKGNFPSADITMYTYGQPRTGNPAWASWVNQQFGSKIFRGVHNFDGVPTMLPEWAGYRHHGVEYWTKSSGASNTVVCMADGEDASCSDSIISTGINIDHTIYYGILAITPYCM
ncbi:hypothetical protein M422DRAFT_41300 [Sphaerobolus stellatus SS14]|nr:hypothetical protein M422DRAFT_41300 [Sphaerobolus stellatus SS14]